MEWGSDEYECDQAIDGTMDGDKREKGAWWWRGKDEREDEDKNEREKTDRRCLLRTAPSMLLAERWGGDRRL